MFSYLLVRIFHAIQSLVPGAPSKMSLSNKLSIEDVDVKDKRVLIRVSEVYIPQPYWC